MVYAAVVMGIVGLLCAAIFRATWPLRWGAGARGVFMMVVGAAAGVLGGLYIGTGVSGEVDDAFARPAVAFYAVIFNTIAWTIGGATSPLPRSPGAATARPGRVLARLPTLTAWQWRALIAIFTAVSALGFISWLGELLTPPQPKPAGATLVSWGSPLSPRQELMTHVGFVGFMAVIGLALAATVLGGNEVVSRFRRGEAGPGTAIIVLTLLPPALIGVGGFVLTLIFLVRSILP